MIPCTRRITWEDPENDKLAFASTKVLTNAHRIVAFSVIPDLFELNKFKINFSTNGRHTSAVTIIRNPINHAVDQKSGTGMF